MASSSDEVESSSSSDWDSEVGDSEAGDDTQHTGPGIPRSFSMPVRKGYGPYAYSKAYTASKEDEPIIPPATYAASREILNDDVKAKKIHTLIDRLLRTARNGIDESAIHLMFSSPNPCFIIECLRFGYLSELCTVALDDYGQRRYFHVCYYDYIVKGTEGQSIYASSIYNETSDSKASGLSNNGNIEVTVENDRKISVHYTLRRDTAGGRSLESVTDTVAIENNNSHKFFSTLDEVDLKAFMDENDDFEEIRWSAKRRRMRLNDTFLNEPHRTMMTRSRPSTPTERLERKPGPRDIGRVEGFHKPKFTQSVSESNPRENFLKERIHNKVKRKKKKKKQKVPRKLGPRDIGRTRGSWKPPDYKLPDDSQRDILQPRGSLSLSLRSVSPPPPPGRNGRRNSAYLTHQRARTHSPMARVKTRPHSDNEGSPGRKPRRVQSSQIPRRATSRVHRHASSASPHPRSRLTDRVSPVMVTKVDKKFDATEAGGASPTRRRAGTAPSKSGQGNKRRGRSKSPARVPPRRSPKHDRGTTA